MSSAQSLARVVMRALWILLGALIGALLTFIGTFLVLDGVGGEPACLPDEAVGCGVAVAGGALMVAILLGAPGGAISANALARYLPSRSAKKSSTEEVSRG
ncbi:hypothetical protein EBE87_23120 [Pseudoroseomonas wenyumeiae]|uniref:Uncharacterized protein n=1 Tax=Teichococcus wenyumeiae TaxID=2478470 RepID=A0A3A9JBK0_9PROT|nr:hypothetical protein [Pseudoroseomonas wenyumeiae]RKK04677.1 hypothetical protein D6Z83_08190 [Pseudoroseomonas wenyumeiae]RMI17320.1 hypothetical protein EBE87_23120 [Pseudoroseomonas wenyumeiae]